MLHIQLVRNLKQNAVMMFVPSRGRKRGPRRVLLRGICNCCACSASSSSQRETCSTKLCSVSGSPKSDSSSAASAPPWISAAFSAVIPLMAFF